MTPNQSNPWEIWRIPERDFKRIDQLNRWADSDSQQKAIWGTHFYIEVLRNLGKIEKFSLNENDQLVVLLKLEQWLGVIDALEQFHEIMQETLLPGYQRSTIFPDHLRLKITINKEPIPQGRAKMYSPGHRLIELEWGGEVTREEVKECVLHELTHHILDMHHDIGLNDENMKTPAAEYLCHGIERWSVDKENSTVPQGCELARRLPLNIQHYEQYFSNTDPLKGFCGAGGHDRWSAMVVDRLRDPVENNRWTDLLRAVCLSETDRGELESLEKKAFNGESTAKKKKWLLINQEIGRTIIARWFVRLELSPRWAVRYLLEAERNKKPMLLLGGPRSLADLQIDEKVDELCMLSMAFHARQAGDGPSPEKGDDPSLLKWFQDIYYIEGQNGVTLFLPRKKEYSQKVPSWSWFLKMADAGPPGTNLGGFTLGGEGVSEDFRIEIAEIFKKCIKEGIRYSWQDSRFIWAKIAIRILASENLLENKCKTGLPMNFKVPVFLIDGDEESRALWKKSYGVLTDLLDKKSRFLPEVRYESWITDGITDDLKERSVVLATSSPETRETVRQARALADQYWVRFAVFGRRNGRINIPDAKALDPRYKEHILEKDLKIKDENWSAFPKGATDLQKIIEKVDAFVDLQTQTSDNQHPLVFLLAATKFGFDEVLENG